jgi:hypothetical protein
MQMGQVMDFVRCFKNNLKFSGLILRFCQNFGIQDSRKFRDLGFLGFGIPKLQEFMVFSGFRDPESHPRKNITLPPPLIRAHLSDLEGAPGEQLQTKGSNHDPRPQLVACPVLGAWGFGH